MRISSQLRELLHKLRPGDSVQIIAKGTCLVGLAGYFFYKSAWACLVLLPAIVPYFIYAGNEVLDKQRWVLTLEFKELVASVNSSIQAGYSVENAFIAAAKDMEELYGPDAAIVEELGNITRGLANHIGIATLLDSFGQRCDIGEISEFAGILAVGKHSGGNIVDIMNSYVATIDEKVEVMQEIETMVSARKFEQKIMNAIPFVILFYVEATCPGFFDVLYHNLAGALVMSVALLLYVMSVLLSKRMIKITL